VFTEVNIERVVFGVITPRHTVSSYQHFGGTYCLHLHDITTGVAGSFVKLVTIYETIRCHKSEDGILNELVAQIHCLNYYVHPSAVSVHIYMHITRN
jgi:hypothetical protein